MSTDDDRAGGCGDTTVRQTHRRWIAVADQTVRPSRDLLLGYETLGRLISGLKAAARLRPYRPLRRLLAET